jgi:hypothetical protein
VGVGFDFHMVWDRLLPLEPCDAHMYWSLTNRETVRCLPSTYR